MKGYALFQKGKNKPIKIALENNQGHFVYALVFATKRGLLSSIDIEDDEEIRKIELAEDVKQKLEKWIKEKEEKEHGNK